MAVRVFVQRRSYFRLPSDGIPISVEGDVVGCELDPFAEFPSVAVVVDPTTTEVGDASAIFAEMLLDRIDEPAVSDDQNLAKASCADVDLVHRLKGASDQILATELQLDEKERAEHLMIVDLVRNDLGRVAEAGSVEVQDLFGLQSLPTVHHLVSEVSATVTAETTLADLILALFPGGSITGAPKIAAQEAIERLEGLRRGFYTGSFGLVDHRTGAATFNILIRTCIAAGGRLYYQTGGGIVADSDPAREWTETQHKAAALVAATRGA